VLALDGSADVKVRAMLSRDSWCRSSWVGVIDPYEGFRNPAPEWRDGAVLDFGMDESGSEASSESAL
jgi:hypothetical protein